MWTVTPPTSHLRKLRRDLGPDYAITEIDLESVIYRDFGNDYDVEISGANTNNLQKGVNVYLWHEKRKIVAEIRDLPQSQIYSCVEKILAPLVALFGKEGDKGEEKPP